ncbi:PAS domain-containing sensor histidine kinase [Methylosinus sp. R-45379]|uniref:sensor histidine kinase n=1 Tax=unclassified Methylosinus TaxID=2624500 RepID=UPI000464DA80|nr:MULTISPECIES: ATP-binding protein [unclassified Methylosinus]OAI31686.1 PAS domain-containing sensor histidine kinase [Methylosinus sp. R-45379]TDX62736.1 PAS domain S-box-containing protein [Methylosinus sp. sav-2]
MSSLKGPPSPAASSDLPRAEHGRIRTIFATLAPQLVRWYRSPLPWRIAIGVLAAAAGVVWRLLIAGESGGHTYVTFYLPVLVASFTGGAVSGALTLVISAAVAQLWLARIEGLEDALAFATFLTTNSLIVVVGEAFQRTLTHVDNLETRHAMERLAAQNARLVEQFGNVALAAPGVVFSFRLDTGGFSSCPYLAENVRNVFGVAPEEICDNAAPMLRRIDGADNERMRASFARSAAQMTLLREQFRYDHPSKGTIWLETQAQPVRQADGSTIWHGYAQDVTERRREEAARLAAERALEQRIVELERVNERLARFAYVASHDLQEPLRKIVAFSQMLDAAVSSSDQKDISYASEVMRGSALRARELVEDLLVYSRVVEAPLKVQRRDLRVEIQSALTDLSELIEESGADVSLDAPCVEFEADPPQFARLMHNLVSNAIKFRRPGETPRIAIHANVEDSLLRLSVSDDGVGFEAKYASAIFEPFKRLHSKAEYPGTGIGLAICKTIADRHGWTLAARSQPLQGATFELTMRLPS